VKRASMPTLVGSYKTPKGRVISGEELSHVSNKLRNRLFKHSAQAESSNGVVLCASSILNKVQILCAYHHAMKPIANTQSHLQTLERMTNAYVDKNFGSPSGSPSITLGGQTQSKVLSPEDVDSMVSR